MKITISGVASSGKSTVAEMVSQKIGYKHYSAGDMQREVAKEMGLSITELNVLEQKDDSIDKKIDAKQAEYGRKDKTVIDGWLSAHFVPKAFHIFLDCSETERVRRRLGHKRQEEFFKDAETARDDLRKREKANKERWLRYYHFDYTEKKNYDLVIDTTKLTVEEVVESILKALKGNFLKEPKKPSQ